MAEHDIIRHGNEWVFPDGTRLPVISGGDGPVDPPVEDDNPDEPVLVTFTTEIPEDLTEVEDTAAAIEALQGEFDAEVDAEGDSDIALLTLIADTIDALRVEETRRVDEAASAQAEIEALRDRVRPEASDEEPEAEPDADVPEPGDDPADAPTDEVVEEPELVTAAVPVPVAPLGRRVPSARAIGANARRPAVPARRTADLVSITAAADVPGHGIGGAMDIPQIYDAMARMARGLQDDGRRVPVATLNIPQQYTIDETMTQDQAIAMLAAACDPTRVLGDDGLPALAASGGWCAPPETVWDFFALESTDGLLGLPTLGMPRGSVQVPDFLGFSDVGGALWTWTEATDIAAIQSGQVVNKALTTNVATLTTQAPHGITSGDTVQVSGVDATFDGTYVTTGVTSTTFTYAKTASNVTSVAVSPPGAWRDMTAESTKGCLKIGCPGFTEYTLEAEGYCVTHGNLSSRAWPELQRRFIALVVAAHLHRLSAAKVAKIQADAADVTIPDSTSDTFGNILNAALITAADIRSQFRMSENAVIDMVFPQWIREPMVSSFAMRNGVDLTDVTLQQATAKLRSRGINPQFVYALQPLYSGAAATAWPTTSKFLAWPGGSYFEGTGGTVDLGVTRDSTLNATNDFTAAWSETFYTVGRRGPAGREVTFTVAADGVTGGP